MKIYPGRDVDLISPFPMDQIHRMVGWLHCYRTIIHSDDSPKTNEDLETYFRSFFQQPNVRSYGIIDKNNKLGIRHEAPLVGFGAFELQTPRNGYFHCATTRKAWGSGMIDEAQRLALHAVFDEIPPLLRVSSFVINNNYPARALAKRIGYVVEGVLQDMVLQDGIPKPITHFGLTRRRWNMLNLERSGWGSVEREEVRNGDTSPTPDGVESSSTVVQDVQ